VTEREDLSLVWKAGSKAEGQDEKPVARSEVVISPHKHLTIVGVAGRRPAVIAGAIELCRAEIGRRLERRQLLRLDRYPADRDLVVGERLATEQFWPMGPYRLPGTVRYPAQAPPGRSSLSRVRENHTHGLRGVC
jgi:hypothetical protein